MILSYPGENESDLNNSTETISSQGNKLNIIEDDLNLSKSSRSSLTQNGVENYKNIFADV